MNIEQLERGNEIRKELNKLKNFKSLVYTDRTAKKEFKLADLKLSISSPNNGSYISLNGNEIYKLVPRSRVLSNGFLKSLKTAIEKRIKELEKEFEQL